MSSNKTSSFFLMAALLYTAANPLAHALFFNRLTTLTVTGRICCTETGTCLAGTSIGLARAPATLNCPLTGPIATTITDITGNFILRARLQRFVSPSSCTINIIPLTAAATDCPLLAEGGGSFVGRVVVISATNGGSGGIGSGIIGGLLGFLFGGGAQNVIGTVLIFIRNVIV